MFTSKSGLLRNSQSGFSNGNTTDVTQTDTRARTYLSTEILFEFHFLNVIYSYFWSLNRCLLQALSQTYLKMDFYLPTLVPSKDHIVEIVTFDQMVA